MSDPIRNVTLSFPCREDWDKFEVVPGGRLCGSCKYIVRDFRDCSAAQLKEAMKSGQRVCGRFNAEQLSPAFLKAAAVAMAVIPMAVGTGCEERIPAPANDSQALVLPVTGRPLPPDSLEFIGDVEVIEDIVVPGFIVEVSPEDSVAVGGH
jgi:hypothetical protein